jgi:hypothetical protein
MSDDLSRKRSGLDERKYFGTRLKQALSGRQ